MAYIGNSPANVGNFQVVDDISSTFNGTLTSFALTALTLPINPAKSGQLLVSINGVLQEPDDTGAEGFLVSGSNIVFSSAPATGSTFWAVWQGQAVDIGTPSDATVGTDQLSATGTKSGTTYLAGDNTWKTVVTDLVNDTTPQLGGDLDLNGHVITGLSTDPTMGGDLSGTASNAQLVANAVGTTEIANSAVTDAKIAGMSSSKLSGTLPAIDGSALTGVGKVLQVVSDTNTTQQIVSSTSWVDTGLSLSLTPSSTSSKVHLQFNFQEIHIETVSTGASFRVTRNGTALFTASEGYAAWAGIHHWNYGDIALDSPSTTAAITYKVQVRGYTATNVKLNYSGNFRDTLIAMEIGA